MKKLLAMLLAVTTVFSSATMTVFADDLTKENPSTEIDSTLETAGSNPWVDSQWGDTNTILCVNVKWTDTTFTYNFGDEWNVQDHKYVHKGDPNEEDGWNRDFINIDVENLSNCPVKAEITEIETLNKNVKVKFDNNKKSKTLTSALKPANVEEDRNHYQFVLRFKYTPKEYVENYKNLINFKVKISESAGVDECEHLFVPSDVSYRESPLFVPTPYTTETDFDEYHYYYHQCVYCGLLEHHTFEYDSIIDHYNDCDLCDGVHYNGDYCEGCQSHIKHFVCYDLDCDERCDLCGISVDFCPDCRLQGFCNCI